MRCFLIVSYTLNHVLVNEISFSKGKWHGTLEGLISCESEYFSLKVPFSYNRTWHFHAFKYPKVLSESELASLKEQFHKMLPEIQESLSVAFIKPREKSVPLPQIHSFQFDEDLSENDLILGKFTLVNENEVFFVNIQLINNEWRYKFSTQHESIDHYKTHYQWEDDLFDVVCSEVEKHSKHRIRFMLHLKKYKFK